MSKEGVDKEEEEELNLTNKIIFNIDDQWDPDEEEDKIKKKAAEELTAAIYHHLVTFLKKHDLNHFQDFEKDLASLQDFYKLLEKRPIINDKDELFHDHTLIFNGIKNLPEAIRVFSTILKNKLIEQCAFGFEEFDSGILEPIKTHLHLINMKSLYICFKKCSLDELKTFIVALKSLRPMRVLLIMVPNFSQEQLSELKSYIDQLTHLSISILSEKPNRDGANYALKKSDMELVHQEIGFAIAMQSSKNNIKPLLDEYIDNYPLTCRLEAKEQLLEGVQIAEAINDLKELNVLNNDVLSLVGQYLVDTPKFANNFDNAKANTGSKQLLVDWPRLVAVEKPIVEDNYLKNYKSKKKRKLTAS